jgi:hypothetical protein
MVFGSSFNGLPIHAIFNSEVEILRACRLPINTFPEERRCYLAVAIVSIFSSSL